MRKEASLPQRVRPPTRKRSGAWTRPRRAQAQAEGHRELTESASRAKPEPSGEGAARRPGRSGESPPRRTGRPGKPQAPCRRRTEPDRPWLRPQAGRGRESGRLRPDADPTETDGFGPRGPNRAAAGFGPMQPGRGGKGSGPTRPNRGTVQASAWTAPRDRPVGTAGRPADDAAPQGRRIGRAGTSGAGGDASPHFVGRPARRSPRRRPELTA